MSFSRLPLRLYFFALFALCVGELCFGILYLQMAKGLEPCPMCIMQRCALLGVGLVALIGALHNRRAWVYGTLAMLIALAGWGVAAQQSWLQLHPEQATGCGASFGYLLETFPLFEALSQVFQAGDCSEKGWTFLGLSIANWCLVTFTGVVIVTPLAVWRLRRAPRG
jgi:disulfide bond formation protein DsbB